MQGSSTKGDSSRNEVNLNLSGTDPKKAKNDLGAQIKKQYQLIDQLKRELGNDDELKRLLQMHSINPVARDVMGPKDTDSTSNYKTYENTQSPQLNARKQLNVEINIQARVKLDKEDIKRVLTNSPTVNKVRQDFYLKKVCSNISKLKVLVKQAIELNGGRSASLKASLKNSLLNIVNDKLDTETYDYEPIGFSFSN